MRKLMILFLLLVGVGAFAQDRINSNGYIEISSNSYKLMTQDGVLYVSSSSGSYDGYKLRYLVKYPQDKSGSTFTVPAGVTTIVKGAFQGNIYLQTIKIPSSVKYISQDAFVDCKSLKSIEMYESTSNIPAYEEDEVPESTEVGRYNIQGVKVEESADGVQIILYSDGSTKKIMK